MSFKEELKKAALKRNIEYINVMPLDSDGYNSVVVALLPYYAGEAPSYFSKYTRGKDYHKLGREILSDILSGVGISDCKILVDVSPLNERALALKAGLGILGKHGLLINEKYGSYVFIITALINTNEEFKLYEVQNCINCKKCIEACPQGALSEAGINLDLCLSQITQKRNISKEEEDIIAKNCSAWGCDVCQDVCPLNKDAAITPITLLKENLLLEMKDINSLSNKEFEKKYGYYALAYKGKKILKRNIELVEKNLL